MPPAVGASNNFGQTLAKVVLSVLIGAAFMWAGAKAFGGQDGTGASCPAPVVCPRQDMSLNAPPPLRASYAYGGGDPVEVRDRRVLADPLYPPLNRSDRPTYEGEAYLTQQRQINVPTSYPSNGGGDTYRLVGYLSNPDDENAPWKVMARQADRNNADFYIVPANRNYDVKVQLTQDNMWGPRLRDPDDMPDTVTFKTPLLKSTPYTYTPLPKTDFAPGYY